MHTYFGMVLLLSYLANVRGITVIVTDDGPKTPRLSIEPWNGNSQTGQPSVFIRVRISTLQTGDYSLLRKAVRRASPDIRTLLASNALTVNWTEDIYLQRIWLTAISTLARGVKGLYLQGEEGNGGEGTNSFVVLDSFISTAIDRRADAGWFDQMFTTFWGNTNPQIDGIEGSSGTAMLTARGVRANSYVTEVPYGSNFIQAPFVNGVIWRPNDDTTEIL